jgi:hypothetical protein
MHDGARRTLGGRNLQETAQIVAVLHALQHVTCASASAGSAFVAGRGGSRTGMASTALSQTVIPSTRSLMMEDSNRPKTCFGGNGTGATMSPQIDSLDSRSWGRTRSCSHCLGRLERQPLILICASDRPRRHLYVEEGGVPFGDGRDNLIGAFAPHLTDEGRESLLRRRRRLR